MSLLDALGSPIFMKYYEGQPFNANHLKPCPMLENPDTLPELVAESGAHSTDLVERETPEQLREKTVEAARAWAPVANRLWDDPNDPMYEKRHVSDHSQGMATSDMDKYAEQGHFGYTDSPTAMR